MLFYPIIILHKAKNSSLYMQVYNLTKICKNWYLTALTECYDATRMPRVRKAILVIGNDISSVRSEVDFPTIYSLYFFFGVWYNNIYSKKGVCFRVCNYEEGRFIFTWKIRMWNKLPKRQWTLSVNREATSNCIFGLLHWLLAAF